MDQVKVILVFVLCCGACMAQEQGVCYGAGSLAGAIVGTLLVTLALAAIGYVIWRVYWRSRRGKHLVLVTDPETTGDQYAFDNPCFKDGTPISGATLEKESGKLEHKGKWSPWGQLGNLVGPRTIEKRRALDDTCVGDPQVNVVALRSHDFTGLGFNICGNMRDGIFVKDVLHRGPASESGRIAPGDRIEAIRISFRHMVFEDALTILSYASPYDVQLEVENTSSSRPSTLIRTKRTSGSSISAADRICHPFYRSQSISDLAQIGKASLKRIQQQQHMGSMPRSPRTHQNEGGSDYPTLKLSPATTNKKEQLRLDKAAAAPAVIVVKPERAKKDQDSLSRLQKFGVRVLPDTAAAGTNPSQQQHQQQHSSQGKQPTSETGRKQVESELHENEHNSKIEQVATEENSRPQQPFSYDERAIDVGPVESTKSVQQQHHGGAEEVSGNGSDNNVKHLLSKGLQNIKEKLHHDKTKKSVHVSESPEPTESQTFSGEGEIPTEIPEEVQRAAMAARNNRKPSGNLENTMSVARKRTESSGSSSAASDAAGSGSADDGRRTPNKKHNKRKAPPPPSEGEDEVDASKQQDNSKPQESSNDETRRPLSLDANIKLLPEGDKMPNIASELPKHHRDSDAGSHEVTNITLDGKSVNSMSAVDSALSVLPTSSVMPKLSPSGNGGVSDSDSDIEHLEGDNEDDSYEKKMKKGGTTIELNSSHITVHHSPSPATSSDNVTTTTTTTAVVGTGDESTRKAASLGDLSRLDYSEQPMSILERAVSLDLADNGNVTPSLGGVGGGKKRKAPLPPGDPVADYLLQDGESGEFLLHRKEPRLDSAMDTFQRRRLKKSSDWGTLEEALLQSDDGKATLLLNKDKASSTSSSPASAPAPSPSTTPSESPQIDSARQPAESSADNEPSPITSASLMNSHHHHYETIALNPQLFGTASITRMDILGNYDEPHYPSSVSDDKKVAEEDVQQKTVLCITPEPTNTEQPHSLGSQVTIASNENIGSLGLGISAETDMAKFTSFSSNNSNPEADQSMDNFPSPSQSLSAIVSSTPITSHLSTNSYPTNMLQSSIVTSSSFSGVSSVHVSSTVPPFDAKEQSHDSNFNDALLASNNGSNSDTADTTSMNTQFVTAVDSTMVPDINEAHDARWISEDSPPPELPTSPVPVLSHHISSFRPSTSSLSTSPSMTYITEIQVVTTNDRAHESPSTLSVESKSSLEEMDSPPPPPPPLPQMTSINPGLLKYVTGPDSNSATINSSETNNHESVGNSPSSVISSTIQNSTLAPAPFKGNVTVTSIRNPERSRIPMRIVTTATERVVSGTNNHPIFSVSNKPARPPVPPRKSESLVENIHIRPNVSKLTTFASQQQQPQSEENSGVGRNSSSFEQWVFLDEGQNGGLESGDELSSSGVSHSTVVSLTPVTRAQSVTHIVLDTGKQTNGDHGKP